jgi:outer membrane lipoprotein carrier protein
MDTKSNKGEIMKKKLLFLFLTTSALISADLTNLKTLETNFIQKIQNSTNNVLTYKGTMFAKKKNNLALWIYNYPVKKKIYYRDGSITVLEPELEQVTFAKLEKIPNILTLLRKAKKVSKNRLVTTFNKTKYYITTNNNFVKDIKYKDEMQNVVTISFKKPKINKGINDKKFVYEIPAGYDVLKQ